MNCENFREFILNCNVPTVLKNINLSWNLFNLSFKEFADLFDAEFDKEKIGWESGKIKCCFQQFEKDRSTADFTLNEFLDKTHNLEDKNNNWYCYNYKYVRDLPAKCKKGIQFEELGFSGLEPDASFWIGSRNSHTACHQDTYGINIVVQVYGKKSWLLFPPSADLKPSRIPYEESSIYSSKNFYCPKNYRDFLAIENDAYHIVLEPGDILIVPRKWWHFVTVLETSLNFNWWIKLNEDQDSQIDECITKILVKEYLKDSPRNVVEYCINPNEIDSFYEEDLESIYDTLYFLIDLKKSNKRLKLDGKSYNAYYLQQQELQQLTQKLENFIEPVKHLKDFELFEVMKTFMQNYRHDHDAENCGGLHSQDIRRTVNLLNVICDKNSVELIKNKIIID